MSTTVSVERPQRLPVIEHVIPESLKRLPHWVGWRDKQRDGNWSKVLEIATETGHNAESDNPATWRTFDVALDAYHRRSEGGPWAFSGIGWCFTLEAGIVGVDLDDCRDPETGEVAEWARDICQQLNSYTELSPSGKGLHVYVYGKLKHEYRRLGKFEVYESGRYFTVTGHRLAEYPSEIQARQEDLDVAYESVFGEKIRAAELALEMAQIRLEALRRYREERIARGEDVQPGDEWSAAWAQATRRGLVDDVLATSKGKRHNAIFSSAARAASLIAGGAPGLEGVIEEIRAAGVAAGKDQHEVDRTVADGAKKGASKPAVPPSPKRVGKITRTITGIALVFGALFSAEDVLASQTTPGVIAVTNLHSTSTTPTPTTRPFLTAPPATALEKIKIDSHLHELSRRVNWATLGDPSLPRPAKKGQHTKYTRHKRVGDCSVWGCRAKCGQPGCPHKKDLWRRCKRFACPSCGPYQRRNYRETARWLWEQIDQAQRVSGATPEAWYVEIPSGADFVGMISAQKKAKKRIPKAVRARVDNMTRWIRSPELNLAMTRDELSALELARANGVEAVHVSSLSQLADRVDMALKRRSAREAWALEDFAKIFKKHDHELVKPGKEAPVHVGADLSTELQAHEYCQWIGKSPVTTAGEDANQDWQDTKKTGIPWPNSKAIRAYVKQAAEARALLEDGQAVLKNSWECPEHGTQSITWSLVDHEGRETALTQQPEAGRPPTWNEALKVAGDPLEPGG